MSMRSSHAPTQSIPRIVRLAAWGAFALAVAGLVLLILRNPFGSGAIASACAVLSGVYAIRRGLNHHPGSQLGLNLGLFNILLWLILFILIQRMLGIDLSSIFTAEGR